jgi:Fe2+ transport system protein FeoA
MIMPLTMIDEGGTAVLRSIEGGRQLKGRLAALGLLPGAELEVIQNSGNGPFVIAVKGSRIVIGRGMAAKISVD